MENKKASSVARAWPWMERSRAVHWSLTACLLQITRAVYGNTVVLPDLKLLTACQCCNTLALHDATLWLGVAGAGAALLAMLLGGRARAHRALAGVAVASAAAIHCVQACLLGVTLVTGPCEGLLAASVMVAVGIAFFATADVHAAKLVLLRGPGAGGKEE